MGSAVVSPPAEATQYWLAQVSGGDRAVHTPNRMRRLRSPGGNVRCNRGAEKPGRAPMMSMSATGLEGTPTRGERQELPSVVPLILDGLNVAVSPAMAGEQSG